MAGVTAIEAIAPGSVRVRHDSGGPPGLTPPSEVLISP